MIHKHSSLGKTQNGFTLVETLVVVAIILFLAGLVFSVSSGMFERGNQSRAISEMELISIALEKYKETFGDYPQTHSAVELLEALDGLRGPKMNVLDPPFRPFIGSGVTIVESAKGDVLLDPWSVAYLYEYKPGPDWNVDGYRFESSGVK